MSKKGFTLVELLITISIIAVLSAIGFVTYSYVMKQGQDSKRQSDLRAIQSALEQYYSDQGYYPFLSSGSDCSAVTAGELKMGCPLKNPAGTKTYMNTVPTDPTGVKEYGYVALLSFPYTGCINSDPNLANRCAVYCLYALLVNSNPGVGNNCNNAWGIGYNFALTPP